MNIKVLCTLGPASLRSDVIESLDRRGVALFRVNLSHTPAHAIEPTIALIRASSSTPICLDTEGPQVRCGVMGTDIILAEGDELRLTGKPVQGTRREFTLWPPSVFEALEIGTTVSVDFDGALLSIIEVGSEHATARVVGGGRVRSNKAVTLNPAPVLAALSEKDLAAVGIGARHGIMNYALSFANNADDVIRLRQLAPPGAEVIAKIESRLGVRNMDAIINAADAVLIDRGDLSRDIPLEYVPYYQKTIVRRSNRWNRPVYVATNLLESMVVNRTPTVAEANDIANTLLDGVHGLVLAAETAVGVDPVGSVDIVLRAVNAFERASESQLFEEDRTRSALIA